MFGVYILNDAYISHLNDCIQNCVVWKSKVSRALPCHSMNKFYYIEFQNERQT